jgi:hypothetical protein
MGRSSQVYRHPPLRSLRLWELDDAFQYRAASMDLDVNRRSPVAHTSPRRLCTKGLAGKTGRLSHSTTIQTGRPAARYEYG